MVWYYIDESVVEGERRKGPFSNEEMIKLVDNGTVSENVLVWHSGMSDWESWSSLEAKAKEQLAQEEAKVRAALNSIISMQNSQKKYAGFFVRACAYVIDNIILCAFGVLLLMLLNGLNVLDLESISKAAKLYVEEASQESLMELLSLPGMHIFVAIWGIIQAAYFVILNATLSATLGKKFLHIHIETANGSSLNFVQAALRYIASLITQCTIYFCGLGYLIVIIDPKRRALHDFIATTRVVYDNKEPKSL